MRSANSENNGSNVVKRPPYVNFDLINAIKKQKEEGKSFIRVKTKDRACTIVPLMVDCVIDVYNGKVYIPVTPNENMIGKKLGEFSPTRTYRGHGDKKSDKKSNKG